MSRRSLALLSICAVLAVSPSARLLGATQDAAPPLSKQSVEAFVGGFVADGMRQDHIAGVSVAIVQNGLPIFVHGYGIAAQAPSRAVQADTPFRIGSITKTFTWVALMREVEKGRVRLDDPVNQYLAPEERIPDQGFTQPIRIRDLMSHAAGTEDLGFGSIFVRDPAQLTTIGRYLIDHRPNRVRAPGDKASYCNYCAVLAGHIVATMEGTDYETVIERDVITPLEMSSTSIRDPRAAIPGLPDPMNPALAARLSDGFSWSNGDFKTKPRELTGNVAPAGGGWSSALDMSRYMTLLLNGGSVAGTHIFDEATGQAFHTPILNSAKDVNGWDHGFIQWPLRGGFVAYGHGGDTVLFHSSMVLVPSLGLGIFVATNSESGEHFAAALPEALVQYFYGKSDPVQDSPAVDKAALAPYVGTYLSTRRAYHGLEQFIGLLQADTVSAGPSGLIAGDKVWVPEDVPGLFRLKDGARVMSFDLGGGQAVRWRGSFNTGQHERATWWQTMPVLFAALGLVAVTVAGHVIGLFVRRQDPLRSRGQAMAGGVQTATALVWLTSLVAFACWGATSADNDGLMYGWPGPFLVWFVWSGRVAALLGLANIGLIMSVVRATGWSRGRKVRYTLSALIFVAATVLIGMRGGLAF